MRLFHQSLLFLSLLSSMAHAGSLDFNKTASFDMPTGSVGTYSKDIIELSTSLDDDTSRNWINECSLTPALHKANSDDNSTRDLTMPDGTIIRPVEYTLSSSFSSDTSNLEIQILSYGSGGRDRRHYTLYCGLVGNHDEVDKQTIHGVTLDFSYASNDTPIISMPAVLNLPRCTVGSGEVTSAEMDIRHKVKGGEDTTKGTYAWSMVASSSNPDSSASTPELTINGDKVGSSTSVSNYRDGVDVGTVSWTCPAKVGSYSWTGTLTFTIE